MDPSNLRPPRPYLDGLSLHLIAKVRVRILKLPRRAVVLGGGEEGGLGLFLAVAAGKGIGGLEARAEEQLRVIGAHGGGGGSGSAR
jgi:hypothetical protein